MLSVCVALPRGCAAHNVFFLILLSLGLTQVPQVQKTEISFTASDSKSYEPYVKNLEKFLKDYSADQQTENIVFQDCGGKSGLLPTPVPLCQAHQKRRVSSGVLSSAVPCIVTRATLVNFNWWTLVSVTSLLIKQLVETDHIWPGTYLRSLLQWVCGQRLADFTWPKVQLTLKSTWH